MFDISEIRTELRRFVRRFDICAADEVTRNYFRLYIAGLISNLSRKNCEAIALQAGMPVRSMQWFLNKQRSEGYATRRLVAVGVQSLASGAVVPGHEAKNRLGSL